MVLKMIVRYLINKYMKDYIEKLDDEKLHVDFTHGKKSMILLSFQFVLFYLGKVSLDNLHLKPEALVSRFILIYLVLIK